MNARFAQKKQRLMMSKTLLKEKAKEGLTARNLKDTLYDPES